MSSRDNTRTQQALLSNTFVGTTILLVGIVGMFLSYNANKGLPFVKTYDLTVEVPDAARLVAGGSEVRIGGARVGVVQSVEAVRPSGSRPPFARIEVALDVAQEGLPADTRATVRPRSLLGAKYLDLRPGRSREEIPADGTLPLKQAVPIVEVSDTFQIFAGKGRKGLQQTILGLGDALAGRGTDLNRTFQELSPTLPALQGVLKALVAPSTNLSGFVDGAAATGAALAPVRDELGSLLDGAATTMDALQASGPALPETIEELPPTERVGTRAMRRLRPVLGDAAAIARDLRPAARLLPRASGVVADGLADTTPVLRRVPELRAPLEGTLRALERLARAPSTTPAIGRLTETVSIVNSLLTVLDPAQRTCNLLGVWTRNTGSAASVGDENGNWVTFLFMLAGPEFNTQAKTPAPDLHFNPYPRMSADGECEAGNEPFSRGQVLGNAPGRQTGTEETAPPPGVRALAAKAGLLEGPGERDR